jgi:hypothetical protein
LSVRQVCLATPNNCPVCLDPADAAASRSWQRPGGWPNDRDRRTSRLFEPLTAWRCIIQRCVPVSSKPGRGIFWGGWTSQCCWSDSAKTGAAREPLATLIGNSLSNSGSRLLKGLKLPWFLMVTCGVFLPDEVIAKRKKGFELPCRVWVTLDEALRARATDSFFWVGRSKHCAPGLC